MIIGKLLYIRSFDGDLLICLTHHEIEPNIEKSLYMFYGGYFYTLDKKWALGMANLRQFWGGSF